MTYEPTEREIREGAERERHDALTARAARLQDDIRDAMRRYEQDAEHIESVYRLRLTAIPPDRHEIIPLRGSVHDHGDVCVTTPGARRDQYPLTAVCTTCHEGIYCADSTADWCHANDAIKHMVRKDVAQVLADVRAVRGLNSIEIAQLCGQPPSMVRRALALMEDDGLARHVKAGGTEELVTWFWAVPPSGGQESLRDKIMFWLPADEAMSWTVITIAQQVGESTAAVRAELLEMEVKHLVMHKQSGRKITWYRLPPPPESLREQITWCLSAGGVPPMGCPVLIIARRTGARPEDVNTELLEMMTDGLAQCSTAGKTPSWYLLREPQYPALSDAAVEAEAEGDAAEQRTAFLAEGGADD